jgi:ABC-type sugar transport system substrate-binding protein
LTLPVTFPSLYVFNALVGSRLSLRSVLRLLVAMLAVMLAVLSSLGPIVVFFAVSTESYPFMKILNVGMATVAGVLGLAFLLRTLHRLVLI